MRNMFALVGFATIAFVGLGWYLGWYDLNRQPGTPGKQKFNLEINPTKLTSDVKKAAECVSDISERLTDDSNKVGPPAPLNINQQAAGPASQFFTQTTGLPAPSAADIRQASSVELPR